MGRYGLHQLCVFVLACGVYFGGLTQMFLLRMRGNGAGDAAMFAFEAILAWLLLAAVYVYWRQLTPLAIHCLCVALSELLMLRNPDAIVDTHFAFANLGPSCWAATLISFPIALGLLALSAVLGRRVEPLANRVRRGFFVTPFQGRTNDRSGTAPQAAESRL